jgi:hypothetical protein
LASNDYTVLRPEDYTVEELRAALSGTSSRLPKVFALNLMRRKDYPERVADLSRVLSDEQQEAAVRHTAAIELGRLGSAEAVAALQQATPVHPFIREGVLRGLRIAQGAPQAGPERPATSGGQWMPSAGNLGMERRGTSLPVADPSTLLRPQRGRRSPIDVRTATPQEVTQALTEIVGQEPQGGSVAQALVLDCQGASFMYIPPPATRLPAPEEVLREAMAVGVVASRYTQEHDRWEARYRVFTQPSGRVGVIEISLTTQAGDIVYAGEGTISGERLSFTLGAVARPGAVPMELVGSFEAGRLTIASGTSATTATDVVAPRPIQR